MFKIYKNNLLFISSNILFFICILFTYIDLNNFEIHQTVYLFQFSYTTYSVIAFFLINLFFLFNSEARDIFKVFIIFIYYIILSSGFYIINFPLMDELILIASSFFFITQFMINNQIFLKKKNILLALIIAILFIQSVLGLYYDSRSIRYIFLYSSLIITFFYFLNLDEIDDEKHKIFINYIFYAIILYVIYHIFFWFLKFYIFEMRFAGQRFIGDMQPSFAKSSSGHFDAIHILTGFLILYFSTKPNLFFKKIILFFSILLFWILADARSSLFLLVSIFLFYFLIIESKKKILLIIFLLLLIVQKDYFNNPLNDYIHRAQVITSNIFTYQSGTKTIAPTYKLEDGSYYYGERNFPAYQDFGRLSYLLSSLNSFKYDFRVIFGCGFYSYYNCANDSIIDIHEKFNVPLNYSQLYGGFQNRALRPTAAGTILVENGFLIVFMIFLYYLNSLTKSFYKNYGRIFFKYNYTVISFYLFSVILSWTIFSNLLDTIFFYLFFFPSFRKYLFYKIR